MVYLRKTNNKSSSFTAKLKLRVFKRVAKTFPLNAVRVFALKLCGFNVGKKVYIGEDLIVASIISEKGCTLTIGNRVAIGPRVTLVLSSDANWSKLVDIIEPIKSSITLDDDCWLGAGVIVLPGITIGKCAIIGSGAVVTKDVAPYTVVAGVPAKIIKNISK